jgi:hypothetical protein
MRDFFCCSKDFYISFEVRCNECCSCNSIVSSNSTTVVQVDKLVTEHRHRYVNESIDNTAIATFFRQLNVSGVEFQDSRLLELHFLQFSVLI